MLHGSPEVAHVTRGNHKECRSHLGMLPTLGRHHQELVGVVEDYNKRIRPPSLTHTLLSNLTDSTKTAPSQITNR